MKQNNCIIGREGEDIAVDYLTKKNFRIIERNYRCRMGEVDIIGIFFRELVFIEVKTRSNISFGYPYEAVDSRKILKIRRVAQNFISERKLYNMDVRFDIISIILNKDDFPKIEHIEYAF